MNYIIITRSPSVIFAGLFTFIFTFFTVIPMSYSQSYLSEIQEKWENSSIYLLDMAEALPDSLYDFRPTPEEMTFREQLIHIANNMIGLSRNQLGFDDENPPKHPGNNTSPADVRRFLKSAFEFAGTGIANETEDSLSTTTKFFAGPKTHRQIINLMNDHVTHHRGQLIVYLRLNGIKPGRYIGW